MVTTYTFFPWSANYAYSKWDVVWGATSNDQRYFYSLMDSNMNTGPLAAFTYSTTNSERNGNVNRMYFTQTGTTYFQQGSIVEIANVAPDASTNYSGVILGGGPGYVDYLNPGLSVSNGTVGGTVRAPIHPYWTTGFAWIPSWTTDINQNQIVYQAKMGEGYSQRMNPVINSNSLSWALVFENRVDKETTALLNFLQDKGGVIPFTCPFPVGNLYNNPYIKYIAGPPQQGMTSYNINGTAVPIQQVFDL